MPKPMHWGVRTSLVLVAAVSLLATGCVGDKAIADWRILAPCELADGISAEMDEVSALRDASGSDSFVGVTCDPSEFDRTAALIIIRHPGDEPFIAQRMRGETSTYSLCGGAFEAEVAEADIGSLWGHLEKAIEANGRVCPAAS